MHHTTNLSSWLIEQLRQCLHLRLHITCKLLEIHAIRIARKLGEVQEDIVDRSDLLLELTT